MAVVTSPLESDASALDGLCSIADVVEVRGNYAGADGHRIRQRFSGKVAYSDGPAAAGTLNGNCVDRPARLAAAAQWCDFVDLSWPEDLTPEVLDAVPPDKRWISWRGAPNNAGDLAGLVKSMSCTPAALFRLSVDSGLPITDAMHLLEGLGRNNVTMYGSGAGEAWSRMLAPWLGAPVVFGTAGGRASQKWSRPDEDGMLSLAQLVRHYGFPILPRLEGIFGIVGRRGSRSLSPLLHNSAYRALGIPALYLPFQASSLGAFWSNVVESGFDRLAPRLEAATVMAPHKEAALQVAGRATRAARSTGGANLLLRQGGGWLADTTDSSGVLRALSKASVNPTGWRVAVVGCGGAGRAAAAALKGCGARVTLVNRGEERAAMAARLLNLEVVSLAGFDPGPFHLIVHATPVCDRIPFDPARIRDKAVVLEMVYAREATPLVVAARRRGMLTIDGWDVLMAEVSDQFRLMTGRALPEDLAETLIQSACLGYIQSEENI